MGQCLRRLADDYERAYGYRPVLVETIVTTAQHSGVSLQAACWTRVGRTASRGRLAASGATVPQRTIWCRALQPDWQIALDGRIEDWHRVLKSGCKAEFLNLQRGLQWAITIEAVIAWRLHAMNLLGRETPELPAGVLFSDLEIRMLRYIAKDRRKPPPDNLGSAVLLMAMLGGYLNRKNDPPPGHKIIWTGYTAMIHYTNAYELFVRGNPERSFPDLRPDRICE